MRYWGAETFLFHFLPFPLVFCALLAPLLLSGLGSSGQHRLCGLQVDESPGQIQVLAAHTAPFPGAESVMEAEEMELPFEIPKSWKQQRARAKEREQSKPSAHPLPCQGAWQLAASHSITVSL